MDVTIFVDFYFKLAIFFYTPKNYKLKIHASWIPFHPIKSLWNPPLHHLPQLNELRHGQPGMRPCISSSLHHSAFPVSRHMPQLPKTLPLKSKFFLIKEIRTVVFPLQKNTQSAQLMRQVLGNLSL